MKIGIYAEWCLKLDIILYKQSRSWK